MFAYLMTWMQLKTDRRAVTALEYGLIAAGIAGVVITAMVTLAPALTGTFDAVTTGLG